MASSPSLRRPPAWALAAIGAAVYLLFDVPTADLAAQEYRAELFSDAGFTLWNNGWYGGHHTPAYSVLFPPLAAAIGVRVVGALAAVAATALFARLAHNRWGDRSYLATLWFAVAALASLVSGRMTFTLGLAIGLGALLALQRGRIGLAAALAAVTSLASPVAGLFSVIAVIGCGLATRDRPGRGLAIVAAALAPAVALGVLFEEGGTEPFVASAFWPALAAIALVVLALPSDERELRTAAVAYALTCVAAFAIATPLGGNVTRLGALFAGPLLVAALVGRRRPAVIALLALPLAYWSLYPAVRDVVRCSGDPSTQRGYHEPLLRFLDGQPGTFRVEIPFTENHWEARHVAAEVPLARGWQRQLDRRFNGLFYDGDLDSERYRAWLHTYAVHYVALPDVPLDAAGSDEARLIEGGLPYLRPVWRDAHWRVFAVRDPAPLADGAARTIELEPDGFQLTATRRGDALVRVHHTRWWKVTSGDACTERAEHGMTRVRVRRPGRIRVQARLGSSAC